jgi:type IV secretion system protein VirB1
MIIESLILGLLSQGCAPGVGANILTGIVTVESGGNPLVVRSNTSKKAYYFRTKEEAATTTRQLIAAGDRNLDIGLGQINYRNVGAGQGKVNLTVEELFDSCKNLTAASTLFKHKYGWARNNFPTKTPQELIRHALSRYNTGDDWRGFKNGYVAKVEAAAFGKGRSVQVASNSFTGSVPPTARPANPWAGGFPGVSLQHQSGGFAILGSSQ